jgi:DNA polymerase-3 subunit beta
VIGAVDLLKACKQAGIIAREGSNVVRFHLKPGIDQTGKVQLLSESDETGASEIELDATVEGQELEIAFNVKFLQDGLEAISTRNVGIETNAHNTPAIIRSADREASPSGEEEGFLYVLMPMHIDGK